MTVLLCIVAFALVGQARGLVELNCSDNSTCIDNMVGEFVRSIREQKAVRLFDTFTIEPLRNARQAKAYKDPLTRLLTSHAISFDWNDFTFSFSNTQDKSDALDLEVYESRTAKDVSDEAPKKSNSKVEEEKPQDKTPKGIRRRHKRKVMQAVIPLLFGMKSAAIAIFSLAVVAVITIKAFLASKLALLVTVGMAAKKLYENYTGGVPETSNILWKLARYFRFLFGLPPPPLSASSMPMPLYSLPPNMAEQMPMFNPSMTMPASQ
ncbi:uncharacterized protein LOC119837760 isoform X2 [Zerene cesonia]|uniref:uncharacterized protein LOC119837760 isoform X2 n=1 Tax=Zerene cesonia TaxID=33412 RepID=UPI0018E513CF|nr:uncharacterized protein LOC119837760 isoform X2 [Zerene cesonia]